MTTTQAAPLEEMLEGHRTELTAYCYRMLGAAFEAEDAVQETMIRAWKFFDRFEGRSALRSWLYRIATNVCLDMLAGTRRRARPVDLGPSGAGDAQLGAPLPEGVWIEPVPDARIAGDPAELAEIRESVRLAFVAALQHLPPRQRAVLILREVLRWRAAEVAELLGTSVAAVNSSLQRARAALAGASLRDSTAGGVAAGQEALLAGYVDAFERYDMDSLTSLLTRDATFSMPPFPLWLETHVDIRKFCLGTGAGCRGSKLVPAAANGMPAFGQYKPDPAGGREAWALQVLELGEGRVSGICFFLDVERFFPLFGLPLRLDA